MITWPPTFHSPGHHARCPGLGSIQANDIETRILCDLTDGNVFMVIQTANVYDQAGLDKSDRDATVDLYHKGMERLQP